MSELKLKMDEKAFRKEFDKIKNAILGPSWRISVKILGTKNQARRCPYKTYGFEGNGWKGLCNPNFQKRTAKILFQTKFLMVGAGIRKRVIAHELTHCLLDFWKNSFITTMNKDGVPAEIAQKAYDKIARMEELACNKFELAFAKLIK